MNVTEIAPGLSRWTALHPDWTPDQGGADGWEQEVGCVYYEASDAVVLIDPLVPRDEPDPFWEALDRDVERAAKPVAVLLTVFWHERSSQEIVERYGGSLWAHEAVPPDGIGARVTDRFGFGDRLPGGVQALDASRESEAIFWLPDHRTVVPGDVLLGTADGGIRVCPDSWLPEEDRHGVLRGRLRGLLALPVRRVLVSHGQPVLARGHEALERALA